MSRVGVALVALLFVLATPASAQSLLESLFGLSAPPPAPVRTSVPMTPGGRPYTTPSAPIMPRATMLDDIDFDSGTRFRTLCVRTCDGYMFPISTRTTRRGFYRDQMRCRAACGDEARLFLVPASAIEMEGAVDIHGRPYTSLRTANLYKKSFVSGCQCRPAPWSATALNRHHAYAVAEEGERAKRHAEAIAQVVLDAGGTIEVVEPDGAEPDPGRFMTAEPSENASPADVAADDMPRAVPAPGVAARPFRSVPRPVQAVRVAPAAAKPSRIMQVSSPPPQPGLFGGPFSLGAASNLTWPGDAPKRR
jgi:hypothetical protein